MCGHLTPSTSLQRRNWAQILVTSSPMTTGWRRRQPISGYELQLRSEHEQQREQVGLRSASRLSGMAVFKSLFEMRRGWHRERRSRWAERERDREHQSAGKRSPMRKEYPGSDAPQPMV